MTDEIPVGLFFDFLNARNLNRLDGLLTEGVQFYFPKTQPLVGKQQIIRFFKILFRQYPELAFEIQGTVIQGAMAAVHWKNRGLNRRGEPYQNEGVTLLRMEGDKITFISDFFKDTSRF
jgi:ketosteroid isomerase-like protein